MLCWLREKRMNILKFDTCPPNEGNISQQNLHCLALIISTFCCHCCLKHCFYFYFKNWGTAFWQHFDEMLSVLNRNSTSRIHSELTLAAHWGLNPKYSSPLIPTRPAALQRNLWQYYLRKSVLYIPDITVFFHIWLKITWLYSKNAVFRVRHQNES